MHFNRAGNSTKHALRHQSISVKNLHEMHRGERVDHLIFLPSTTQPPRILLMIHPIAFKVHVAVLIELGPVAPMLNAQAPITL
jgi:hypothetical protein